MKNSNLIKYVCCLLALSSVAAHAEWQEVGKSQQGSAYVDLDTIVKSGSVVRMSTMLDMKRVQNIGENSYLSIASVEEFDCQSKMMRQISAKYYEGNLSSGRVSHFSDETDWFKVSTQTSDWLSWAVACGKASKKNN